MSDQRSLYRLNELSDFQIASGYPDVRGWEVRDADNRVIGKVDELLVNTDSKEVVYLDIQVDKTIIEAGHDPYCLPSNINVREFVNQDGENHVIVPIGLAEIYEDRKYLQTNTIDYQTFASTKRIRKGAVVDRGYEVIVLDSYGRTIKSETYEPEDNPVAGEEIKAEHYIDDAEARRPDYNKMPNDDMFYKRREFENRRFRKKEN